VFQLAGLACQHVCNWVESLGTTVRKVLCIGPPGGVNVVLRAPLLTYCCLFTVLAIPPSEETLLQLLLSDLPGHSIATPNRAKAQSAPPPPNAHVKVGATPQTPWATPSNESSAHVLNRTYHAEQWGCTSAPPPRPAPGQSHLPLSEDSKRIPHTRMYVEWPPHP
jgi:hypothetical protein